MTTRAYAVKRALFAELNTYTGPDQPLAGVEVSYAWTGDAELECIYGGGIRFDHQDAVAEHPGVLVRETGSLSLYIRVCKRPAVPVEEADARAEAIGAAIGAILRANPAFAGGGTWLGLTAGQGDYSQTGDETVSILSYQVTFACNLAYDGGA